MLHLNRLQVHFKSTVTIKREKQRGIESKCGICLKPKAEAIGRYTKQLKSRLSKEMLGGLTHLTYRAIRPSLFRPTQEHGVDCCS